MAMTATTTMETKKVTRHRTPIVLVICRIYYRSETERRGKMKEAGKRRWRSKL